MHAENAPSVASGDVEHRRNAMERDLERGWDRVRDCLGAIEPNVLEIARNSFWLGVKTGVTVTTKALNGAYR